MKDFSRFQAIAFLALGMSGFCARSGAQGTIGLGVTDSPDPVFVNGTLFMPLGRSTFSGGGRQARLDLNGAIYVSAGINWPF